MTQKHGLASVLWHLLQLFFFHFFVHLPPSLLPSSHYPVSRDRQCLRVHEARAIDFTVVHSFVPCVAVICVHCSSMGNLITVLSRSVHPSFCLSSHSDLCFCVRVAANFCATRHVLGLFLEKYCSKGCTLIGIKEIVSLPPPLPLIHTES